MATPSNLTGTAGRVLRDVKALGTSAPLRAVYEASKRSNFHKVLFREVDPASVPRSVVLPLGTRVPEAPAARTRCLDDARAILAEGTRVFGRRTATGSLGAWGLDPLVNEEWPATTPWWQIDIRTDARLSDVKFVWEAGRHRDLVVLARAAVIEPEGPWFDHLVSMLERWIQECQPEQGVHWYSSLELALRAIAWSQVIALVGDRLTDEVRSGLDHHLMASARHILVELPYTVSSMKNNHLLGDGLGLVVLGRMFPEQGEKWARTGDRLMLAQLRRHMHSDGSMIEDSLSYHRFVLEMFIVRHLLGGASEEIDHFMERAALHLQRLGALDGPVPQFGDWDEGRVLSDSRDAGSVAGSALAALALSGYAVGEEEFAEYDELAWYVGSAGSAELPANTEAWQRAGDFVRLAAGEREVWFKTGTGPSHQHADVTSVWIRNREGWVTQDPGTGTYNGPLHIRNGFRTSAAHPVWVPEGEDQLEPHRAFRWMKSIKAGASYGGLIGETVAFLAVHDAFAGQAGRVARVVLVEPEGITVVDAAENGTGSWTMSIPLGDAASGEEFFGLDDAVRVRGQEEPWAGWHSDTYGSWQESDWLQVRSSLSNELRWGIGKESDVQISFRFSGSGVDAHLSTDQQRVSLRATAVTR